jgi:hypothetical protein
MKARRTERQLIEAIKSEVEGMKGYDARVIAIALNGRYHPTKIQQALKELQVK